MENMVYINVRERYNSIISIKSDKEHSVERNIIGCDKIKNCGYINARVRLCAATPPSVIANSTPPPPSQKHHFVLSIQTFFLN